MYFIKVYKEIESYLENRAFAAEDKVVEIFDASFALNETKSELHEIKRRSRAQTMGMQN